MTINRVLIQGTILLLQERILNTFVWKNKEKQMATWVMIFIVFGKYGTSSISVDFNTQEQCQSAYNQTASIIPSNKDGYFYFGFCAPK